MPFKLPDFANSYCHAVMACGGIKSKSQNVLRILRSEPDAILSRYQVNHDPAWLLVMLGGGKDGFHFHVEAMTEFLAKERELNKQNRPIEDVQELLRPTIGRRIEVTVSGIFLMPIDKVPEGSLIQPRFFTKRKGKFRVKTTGMDFEIEGTIIPYLSWMLIEESTVRVDLVTRLTGKIDEDYLDRFFQFLESAFRAYVFGEEPNERGR